jgi:hypothetical protein
MVNISRPPSSSASFEPVSCPMIADNVNIKMMNLFRSFEIIANSFNFVGAIINEI